MLCNAVGQAEKHDQPERRAPLHEPKHHQSGSLERYAQSDHLAFPHDVSQDPHGNAKDQAQAGINRDQGRRRRTGHHCRARTARADAIPSAALSHLVEALKQPSEDDFALPDILEALSEDLLREFGSLGEEEQRAGRRVLEAFADYSRSLRRSGPGAFGR